MTVATLELASVRTMMAGAIRLAYAVVFTMTLGLSIAIGTEFYEVVGVKTDGFIIDYTCSIVHHEGAPWYQRPISPWFGMYIGESCLQRI